MDLSTLEERVLEIVQDASFSGNVLPFLNRGIELLAGRFKLMALDTTDTVDCTVLTNFVALPETFMHGLYFVGDGEMLIGERPHYRDYARFMRKHPKSYVGPICDVVERNKQLFYIGQEDKTLTVSFFEKPTLLVNDTDEPLCLPDHLHEPLLANFAAREIFNIIEDGVEDPKTNTKIYHSLFNSYLNDLSMYTVNTDGPAYVSDEADRI